MRGICSLTVFLNHWFLWSNFAPFGGVEMWLHRWLDHGFWAFVSLAWPTGGQHPALVGFFVLSGFCVHRPFECRIGQAGPPVKWRDYFSRRVGRIMPVYWTGALLGLLVVAAVHLRPTEDLLLMLHTAVTPAQITARLGGFSGLWPEEISAGNYILSTVGVEILIYAVYPLFFLAASARRWLLLGLIAIGLHVLALMLQPYVDPFVLFSSVLVMGLFWYMGALVAHWHEKHEWTVPGWWLGGAWALFLSLKLLPPFYGLNTLKQAVWGVLCMWLIGWLLGWEKRSGAVRDRRWSRVLRWFGRISYPLYAVHTPVILLVNWAMLSVIGSRNFTWQLTANLVLSLAVTLVVHHQIEQRFYPASSPDRGAVRRS